LIVKLLKYLRGYVTFRLMGFSPERFLNLCSNHNILLWDLRNIDSVYEMKISVKGLKQLRPLLKKTKTKIIIKEKVGFPFFLHRHRKRKSFFIGIIVCIAIITLLSVFIWNIDVEGNYSRTTEVILEYLEEEGITHGLLKKDVDCVKIERLLRAKFGDIIWVSAKVEGTRLKIKVQENTDIDLEDIVEYEASDLVANKEGIITAIITRAGKAQVTVGDNVAVDELLVSGRVDIMDDSKTVIGFEYYPADADIYIQTTYTYQDEFSFTYEYKEFTGKSKKTTYIKLFETNYGLFPKDDLYEESDRITNEKQLKLTESFYIPIHIGTTKQSEYVTITKRYTEEEAINRANESLVLFNEKLMEKGVQIFENNVRIEMNEEFCKAYGQIIVIEKIGKRVPAQTLDSLEEGTIENEYN
jgi:sporulation protein YqfD